MSHKLFRMLSLIAILALALTPMGVAKADHAKPGCVPAYVKMAGSQITVLPTGKNDTANIQCAFDVAVAAGRGMNVQLVKGTYKTAQIVAFGFKGTFNGAGQEKTVITNLPTLKVTPVDMYLNPPSAANPWPMLFYFGDVDILVRDLTIRIVGEDPTTPWTIFGIDPPLTQLAAAIGILGTHSDVEINRVLVEGENTVKPSMFTYNLINGIYFEGWGGEVSVPISGSFLVRNSTFRKMASGSPITNLTHASAILTHNVYNDVYISGEFTDLDHSSVEFSHNLVAGVYGANVYNFIATEDVGAFFLIKNNVFQTTIGVAFGPAGYPYQMGKGSKCLIQGNNFKQVDGTTAIYLGPNTHDCTVAGNNTKGAIIINEGTGNVIRGPN